MFARISDAVHLRLHCRRREDDPDSQQHSEFSHDLCLRENLTARCAVPGPYAMRQAFRCGSARQRRPRSREHQVAKGDTAAVRGHTFV